VASDARKRDGDVIGHREASGADVEAVVAQPPRTSCVIGRFCIDPTRLQS
jgi:hypothetical protein